MHEMLTEQRKMTEAVLALVEVLKNQQPSVVTVREFEAEKRYEQAVFNFQNENENSVARKKPSKKLIAAISWLLKNDPKLEMRVVDVVSATGVSLGTVDAARKLIRSGEYKDYIES